MALNVGELFVQLNGDNKSFDKSMSSAQKTVDKTAQKIDAASKTAQIAFAAMGAGAILLSKDLFKFEQSMARVNTIIDVTPDRLEAISKETLRVSNAFGKMGIESSSALYDITSAGIATNDSLGVLEKSTKASVAGFTQVSTSVKAGTTILNAYGLEIGELDRVFDLQFATVKKGVLTYEQLAASLGSLTPSANKLGVSLEEMFGTLAFLTNQGQSAEEASTALARAFDGIIDKADGLKEIGIDIFDTTGNFVGFEKVISQLSTTMEGLTDEERNAMLELVGFDIRATRAIIPAINNFGKFKEIISEVSNSAGSMDVAFKNATDATEFEIKRLLATFSNVPRELILGSDTIKLSLKGINDELENIDFGKLFSSEEASKIKDIALGIAGITVVLAVAGAGVALLSNPLVQLIAISAAVRGAFDTNFLGLKSTFDFVLENVKAIAEGMQELISIPKKMKLDNIDKAMVQINNSMEDNVITAEEWENILSGDIPDTLAKLNKEGVFDFKEIPDVFKTELVFEIDPKDQDELEKLKKGLEELYKMRDEGIVLTEWGTPIESLIKNVEEDINALGKTVEKRVFDPEAAKAFIAGINTELEKSKGIVSEEDITGIKKIDDIIKRITNLEPEEGSVLKTLQDAIEAGDISIDIGKTMLEGLADIGVIAADQIDIIFKALMSGISDFSSNVKTDFIDPAEEAARAIEEIYKSRSVGKVSIEVETPKDIIDPKLIAGLSESLTESIGNAINESDMTDFGDNIEKVVYDNIKIGLIQAFLDQQNFEALSTNILKALEDGNISMEEQLKINFDIENVKTGASELMKIFEELGIIKVKIEGEEEIEALQDSFKSVLEISTPDNLGENIKESVYNSVKSGLIQAFLEKGIYDKLANSILDALKDGKITIEEQISIDFEAENAIVQSEELMKVLDELGISIGGVKDPVEDLETSFSSIGIEASKLGGLLENDLVSAIGSVMNELSNIQSKTDIFGANNPLASLIPGFSVFTSAVSIFQSVASLFGGSTETQLTASEKFQQAVDKFKAPEGSDISTLDKNIKSNLTTYKNLVSGIESTTEEYVNLAGIEYKEGSLQKSFEETGKFFNQAELGIDFYFEGTEEQFKKLEDMDIDFDLVDIIEDANTVFEAIKLDMEEVANTFGTAERDIASAVGSALSSSTVDDFGANLQDVVYENVKEGLIKSFLAQESFQALSDTITLALVDEKIDPFEQADIDTQVAVIAESGKVFLQAMKDAGLIVEDIADELEGLTFGEKLDLFDTAAEKLEIYTSLLAKEESKKGRNKNQRKIATYKNYIEDYKEDYEGLFATISEGLGTTASDLQSSVSSALSSSTVETFGENLQDAIFDNVKQGLIKAFLAQESFEALSQSITEAIADGELTLEEKLDITGQLTDIEAQGENFLEALEELGLGFSYISESASTLSSDLDNLGSEVKTAAYRSEVAQGTVDFSGLGYSGAAFSSDKTQVINVNIGDVVDREKLVIDVKNAVGTAISTSQNRLYGTSGGVANV